MTTLVGGVKGPGAALVIETVGGVVSVVPVGGVLGLLGLLGTEGAAVSDVPPVPLFLQEAATRVRRMAAE
jgi:hypothetical protein